MRYIGIVFNFIFCFKDVVIFNFYCFVLIVNFKYVVVFYFYDYFFISLIIIVIQVRGVEYCGLFFDQIVVINDYWFSFGYYLSFGVDNCL